MTVCTKCGQDHDRYRDAEHTKPASWCAKCYAAYQRENRPKHKDMRASDKRKSAVRKETARLESSGKIERKECCEKCNKPESEVGRLERHHPKYSAPHKVKYFCRPCHVATHLDERREANERRAAAGKPIDNRTAYKVVRANRRAANDDSSKFTSPGNKRAADR